MTGLLYDPEGKRSNIRLISLLSLLIGGALALAPLWGGPEPKFEVVALFVVGGPGLKVWQRVGGEQKQ